MKTTTIIIKDYCSTALSQSSAEIIREEIDKVLNKFEKIILDFSDITLFATPFFNLAIGHFVTKLTPKIFAEKIECVGLNELGKETYEYSLKNAYRVYEQALEEKDIEEISDIIKHNMEET